MTTLNEALRTITEVHWATLEPQVEARVSDFLKRAADELLAREEATTKREQAVSEREAAATLLETNLKAREHTLCRVESLRTSLTTRNTSLPHGVNTRSGGLRSLFRSGA